MSLESQSVMDKKENIETAETEEKRISCDWKRHVAIFIVLPIILTILFPLGGFWYICGRFYPFNNMYVDVCMLEPVIGIFIIYCFVAGIGKYVRDWRKSKRKGKYLITAQIGIPIAFVVLLVFSQTSN